MAGSALGAHALIGWAGVLRPPARGQAERALMPHGKPETGMTGVLSSSAAVLHAAATHEQAISPDTQGGDTGSGWQRGPGGPGTGPPAGSGRFHTRYHSPALLPDVRAACPRDGR